MWWLHYFSDGNERHIRPLTRRRPGLLSSEPTRGSALEPPFRVSAAATVSTPLEFFSIRVESQRVSREFRSAASTSVDKPLGAALHVFTWMDKLVNQLDQLSRVVDR